ncbi:MAG: 5-formyltetrahydrofolate cyclo-ligase [Ruminococcus sp.]|nr:5-formyltetrahydrofolate cyclo-ligase [Ruminococcus sp.]
MDDKKTLRKKFSVLRKSLKTDVKDSVITAKLLSMEDIIDADTVLLYASFGSEINTWELARTLLANGKPAAFPKCGENGLMTFHIITSVSQLDDGKYGICEPDGSLPQPDMTDRTVCIVPGLAFTPEGGRLGYGGGFYDRFLAEHPEAGRIALAYDGMIVSELPLLPHDLKVDTIVTEERTVFCNAEK